MKIEQKKWTEADGWKSVTGTPLGLQAQLVFVFASPLAIGRKAVLDSIHTDYPQAIIMGCSTAGEICDIQVSSHSLVTTAISFERTQVRAFSIPLDAKDCFRAGRSAAEALPPSVGAESLRNVFVLSEGLGINASDVVGGVSSALPEDVTVTGGLAGDGDNFRETYVICDGEPSRNTIGVLGFYGGRLKIGVGSLGGWDPFGPERLVTRSDKNVLYELDSRPALALYKQYLGEHAKGLPATGLFFPLYVRSCDEKTGVIRTFLAFDEATQSMTFSGNILQGSYARLAKSNASQLVDGAAVAASQSIRNFDGNSPELAILVSCMARRLVMKQRTEEEVEAVRLAIGKQTVISGFYSYGEIAPLSLGGRCELHNQTMTITTFSEV